MREMKVKGTGTFIGQPDLIEVTFSLITESKTYEETLKIADQTYNNLKDALVDIGFNEDDLKTTYFSINAYYEQIKDNSGNYVSVFRGYRLTHNLRLEFDLDIDRLGEVLEVINNSNTKPNININFTIKDKDFVKQEVLKDAVNNAKELANILADASSVNLGYIKEIIYDNQDLNIYSKTNIDANTLYAAVENVDFNITPQDIEVIDFVLIVWEIN